MIHGRRLAALVALLGAAVATGGCSEQAPEPPTIRKIVMISIDTLRADYLTPYNELLDTSPNIADLAERSFLFEDAIAPSTSTLPSHTSLIYSMEALVHQAYFHEPAAPLLESPVETLQGAGFATAGFVGGGQLREGFGFNRGYDLYEEITTTYVPGNPPPEDRLAQLRRRVTGFLRRNADNEAFVFVHNYVPHYPHYPPEEHHQRYLELAEQLGSGDHDEESEYVREIPEDPDLAWYLATPYRVSYAALVRYADEFVGGVLEDLERLEIADETAVILLSDHGETLGERGMRGHGTFHPEVLRVPLIIHVPGVEGARISAPTGLLDVMPTVFSLLGREFPYDAMGLDLTPQLLRAEPTIPADRIRVSENRVSATRQDFVAVLQDRWKLVFSPGDPESVKLHDRTRHPVDAHDFADQESAVVSRLVAAYQQIKRETSPLLSLFPRSGTELEDMDPAILLELRALGYIQ